MSHFETNPYASPAAETLPPLLPTAQTGYFYRDGKFLVVSNHAVLPSRCLLTNQPVGESEWRKSVSIAWTPPWLYVTLLAGGLIAIVLILVMQKKAKITYALSPEGRGRIWKKQMVGWLLLASSAGLFFTGFSQLDGSSMAGIAMLGGFLVLIASWVFFAIANPIKAVKYRDGWFRVKGCSPQFLDSLPPMPGSPF